MKTRASLAYLKHEHARLVHENRRLRAEVRTLKRTRFVNQADVDRALLLLDRVFDTCHSHGEQCGRGFQVLLDENEYLKGKLGLPKWARIDRESDDAEGAASGKH